MKQACKESGHLGKEKSYPIWKVWLCPSKWLTCDVTGQIRRSDEIVWS